MKFLQIVVGICLILAVAWAVLLRARRGTESMAALRKFRYAHRGLYDKEAGIPENSLPAFSRAIARGFGAELDVHLLRDGTLAVFHDSDVKRMTGREGYLEDLSADELKDYALDGTKEAIRSSRMCSRCLRGRACRSLWRSRAFATTLPS